MKSNVNGNVPLKKQQAFVSRLKLGSNWSMITTYGVLIIAAIFFLLPFTWLVGSSLKNQQEFLMGNTWGLPKQLNLENYINAWTTSNMGIYLRNSLYVAFVTIALSNMFAATISFILARFKFKLNRPIYYIIIAGMMIPIHSAVIPLYLMAMDYNMQNNLTALATIYAAFRISLSVFMLESFMSTIPNEIEECAYIDGCGPWRLFVQIILPLSRDGLVVITILSALACWNELLVSMLMISEATLKTIPIGLTSFISEFTTDYGRLTAGIVIACIPNILFYIFMQEKIEKGVTMGAVKG